MGDPLLRVSVGGMQTGGGVRTTHPHPASHPLPLQLTTPPSLSAPRTPTLPHTIYLCCFLCLHAPVPPLRLASYHAEEPGDLSCYEGEIFHLLADEGEGWVRVARAGGDMAEGILPLSYLTKTVTTVTAVATDTRTRPGPGKPGRPIPQPRSPIPPLS